MSHRAALASALALGASHGLAPSSAWAAPDESQSLTPQSTLPEPGCLISVQVTQRQGLIIIDGEPRGDAAYEGSFVPGRHTLRVERAGYEPFDSSVTCKQGDVHAESVLLKPSVALGSAAPTLPAPVSHDGIYGGVQLLGAFQPAGSGTTFQDACDTTGATRCAAGSVAGAGLGGYVGWMVEPLGLELALFTAADVVSPQAAFDGVNGSEINPILAAPARRERFTIARFGGGTALRARFTTRLNRFRLAAAIGPGLVYRYLVMKRDTQTVDDRVGVMSDSGTGYVSALLSMELSAQLLLGKSTALSVGVTSWFEHAGSDTKTEPQQRAVLLGDDGPPLPQATPAYDMAGGSQWFLGPFIGLAFGA